MKDLTTKEHRAFLDNKDTTKGTNGGKKAKSIRGIGAKLPNIRNIKSVSLGFLDANDITATLSDLVSNGFPLTFSIDTPDISVENLP